MLQVSLNIYATMASWVIYSDINTMCTFPPPSLTPSLLFSIRGHNFHGRKWDHTSRTCGRWAFTLWGFGLKKNHISVYVAAVKTWVGRWAEEIGLHSLWGQSMPESQTWVYLGILWCHMSSSDFAHTLGFRASGWMAGMTYLWASPCLPGPNS